MTDGRRETINLMRLAGTTTVVIAVLAAGAGSAPASVETIDLGRLRLLVQQAPARISWHLDGRLLVADKPHRERGTIGFLLEEGWRHVREVRSIRRSGTAGAGEALLDLACEGGRAGTCRIAWGRGPGVLVEIEGPPGSAAVRHDLLRYTGERLLGVEGVRWDDPEATVDPRRDPVAAARDLLASAGRSFISSRGYGVVIEAAAGKGPPPSILAPDPDTLRIEVRSRRFSFRLVAGPEPRRVSDGIAAARGSGAPAGKVALSLPATLAGLREAAGAAQALAALGLPAGSLRLRFEAGPATPSGAGREAFDRLLSAIAARLPVEVLEPSIGAPSRGPPPPIRPLFLAEPYDAGTWSCPDAWLSGEDIIIAPIFAPAAGGREVRLPAGAWETAGEEGRSEVLQGPATVSLKAPEGDDSVIILRRKGTAPR